MLILQTDDIPTIAQRMANLPKANSLRPRVAMVTQGTSHTVYAESGVSGYRTIPVRKIPTAEVVDTTGAG